MSDIIEKYKRLDDYMHEKLRSSSISGRALEELYGLQKHAVNELFDMDLGSYYAKGLISARSYTELVSYVDFVNDSVRELNEANGNPLSTKGTVMEKLNDLPDDIYVYLGAKSGWMTVQLCCDLRNNIWSLSNQYKKNPAPQPQPKKKKDGTMSIPKITPWVDFPDRRIKDVYLISALNPNGLAIKMEGLEGGNSNIGLGDLANEKRGPKPVEDKEPGLKGVERNKKVDSDWEDARNSILDAKAPNLTRQNGQKRERLVIDYKKRGKNNG